VVVVVVGVEHKIAAAVKSSKEHLHFPVLFRIE
jgi:hypothetical protein